MTPDLRELLWKAYIERVRIGYKMDEVPGNFLGDVEMHKRWFMEAAALAQPEQIVPNGWIATSPSGRVIHFSKHKGWTVEEVSTERVDALAQPEGAGLSKHLVRRGMRPDGTFPLSDDDGPALAQPEAGVGELIWWEKTEGYAVGLRDKGMIAWVATVEEAQALCAAFRKAAPPAGEGMVMEGVKIFPFKVVLDALMEESSLEFWYRGKLVGRIENLSTEPSPVIRSDVQMIGGGIPRGGLAGPVSDTPMTDREEYTITARDVGFKAVSPGLCRLIENRLGETRKLYDELLFMVSDKFPEETRHQTALRYLREREQRSGGPDSAKAGEVS